MTDPIEFELDDISSQDEDFEEEQDESLTFALATHIMKEFGPGFVVICSPHFDTRPDGVMVPSELSIALNADADFTKSTVSVMLKSLAEALDEEIAEIEREINDDSTE